MTDSWVHQDERAAMEAEDVLAKKVVHQYQEDLREMLKLPGSKRVLAGWLSRLGVGRTVWRKGAEVNWTTARLDAGMEIFRDIRTAELQAAHEIFDLALDGLRKES